MCFIGYNEYFGFWSAAYIGSFIINIGLFFAVFMILYYYCKDDSPSERNNIMISFMVAAVFNFINVLFISIYYSVGYQKESVPIFLGGGENYSYEPKGEYIAWRVLISLFFGCLFIYFYCWTRKWVELHKNQEKAYG